MAISKASLSLLSAADGDLLKKWLLEFEQSWKENLLAERVDVDRLVIQIDSLGAVNGNHHANDRELLHRLGFRDIDVDAGLQDRGRDHENNQKDKHDVDERNHIDFGK